MAVCLEPLKCGADHDVFVCPVKNTILPCYYLLLVSVAGSLGGVACDKYLCAHGYFQPLYIEKVLNFEFEIQVRASRTLIDLGSASLPSGICTCHSPLIPILAGVIISVATVAWMLNSAFTGEAIHDNDDSLSAISSWQTNNYSQATIA